MSNAEAKKDDNTASVPAVGCETPCYNPLLVAFVQGAQWWEYHSKGATMFPSDRDLAEEEGLAKQAAGTLGKHPEELGL